MEATPEEVKKARFFPALIRSLRKNLGISQKELAILAGGTVRAARLREKGKFEPKDEEKAVMVALRKLGHRDLRKLLKGKVTNQGA